MRMELEGSGPWSFSLCLPCLHSYDLLRALAGGPISVRRERAWLGSLSTNVNVDECKVAVTFVSSPY